MDGNCYHCGSKINFPKPMGRADVCPSCDRDIRVCKNCRFYDPGAHWDCRESIPEAVRDKERGNFCDYFSPRPSGPGNVASGDRSSGDAARTAFMSLFSDDE